jgi:hypothetical protein
MFNVLTLGVNRIWSLSHTDSKFFDTTGIFNSVAVSGYETLNLSTPNRNVLFSAR